MKPTEWKTPTDHLLDKVESLGNNIGCLGILGVLFLLFGSGWCMK